MIRRPFRLTFASTMLIAILIVLDLELAVSPTAWAQDVNDVGGPQRMMGFEDLLPESQDVGFIKILMPGIEDRKIHLLKGKKKDPGDRTQVVFKHSPVLALIPNPQPIPGYPSIVYRAQREGTRTYLTFYFRLSSPKVRDAAMAILREIQADRPANGDGGRADETNHRLKVEPMDVLDLYMLLQDKRSGATLAYRRKVINSLGDAVELIMDLDPDSLADFSSAAEANALQFQPIYLPNGQQIEEAGSKTTIDFELALEAKGMLESRQLSGSAPIFKAQVDAISRKLTGRIRHEISANSAAAATLLKSSSTLLLGKVFEPGGLMSLEDLKASYRDFDAAMLAEYLRPLVRTTSKTLGLSESMGGQTGMENEVTGGISAGVSLGYVSFGMSIENRQKFIQTLTELSGVEFQQNETKNRYEAHRIQTFRLAAGKDKQAVEEVSVVTLGKGRNAKYVVGSPFGQDYTEAVVEDSLNAILGDQLVRLTALKRKHVAARNEAERNVLAVSERCSELVAASEAARARYRDESQALSKTWEEYAGHYASFASLSGQAPLIVFEEMKKNTEKLRDEALGKRDEAKKRIDGLIARTNTTNDELKGLLQKLKALEAESSQAAKEISKAQAGIDRIEQDLSGDLKQQVQGFWLSLRRLVGSLRQ